MKPLFAAILATVVLNGCAKNEITLSNQWQEIDLSAGGQVFQVDRLARGATKTLRFKSSAEGGAEVRGKLNGQFHQSNFGYFTPGMSTAHSIQFHDDGKIAIAETP